MLENFTGTLTQQNGFTFSTAPAAQPFSSAQLQLAPTQNLTWIELYKSDRVADISLTQWLALTPSDIVANTLKIPLSVVQQLKKQKQLLLKG
jgi:hypothetical protein